MVDEIWRRAPSELGPCGSSAERARISMCCSFLSRLRGEKLTEEVDGEDDESVKSVEGQIPAEGEGMVVGEAAEDGENLMPVSR